MNSHLLSAASLVIPSPQFLVNVVSKRVRQLSLGHRPLVVAPPGMGLADIALTEIIDKKLTYEAVVSDAAALLSEQKIVGLPVSPRKHAA